MPSFRAVTVTTAGSSANPAISTPTGTTAGDLILVICKWTVSISMTGVPTGFTIPSGTGAPINPGGGSGVQYAIWTKVADGTEGATLTFTMGSSGTWTIAAATYQDVTNIDGTTPLSDSQSYSATSTTTTAIPAMTVGRASSLAVVLNMYDTSSATWTPPTSFVERLDSSGFEISDLAESSNTGTLTSTKSGGADICVGFGVILQPPLPYVPPVPVAGRQYNVNAQQRFGSAC